MLKCITFDGDASTLDTLMSYFEKQKKKNDDVHEVLHKETADPPVFVTDCTRKKKKKKRITNKNCRFYNKSPWHI